jgi:hypothetical protein
VSRGRRRRASLFTEVTTRAIVFVVVFSHSTFRRHATTQSTQLLPTNQLRRLTTNRNDTDRTALSRLCPCDPERTTNRRVLGCAAAASIARFASGTPTPAPKYASPNVALIDVVRHRRSSMCFSLSLSLCVCVCVCVCVCGHRLI